MTEMHATAEPAYLDRLALHSNPFSRQNLPGAFFAGRQTSQRINLILHLLRSSSQITLVAAPDGYGKSMLLTALYQRGGEDLRFCILHASNTSNLTQITQHCLQAFGATGDSQLGGDQQLLLRQRLQQLLQIQVTPVLLIDDAEKLDNSVQQQLATWLNWQHDGQSLLRAVVTTNKASAMKNLRNERFQELDLLPLASDEINAYLQQRMQAAGWQDDLPFNQKQLQRIQRRSKGIPAEINHQAHQSLLGINKSWQYPNLTNWRIPGWFRLIPVLLVILTLVLVLIFQQNINDWLNQNRDENGETITELTAEPTLPIVVVDDTTVTSNALAEKENLMKLLEELESEQLSDGHQATDLQKSDKTSEPVVPAFTPVVEKPIGNKIIEAPVTDTPISTAPVLSNAVSKNTENSANQVRGTDWILRQAKSAYTFQLIGSWERAEVDEFIEKYRLSGDVAVFASMRNNKVWHALIYGVYDSKRAAVNASHKWPEPLKGVSTWLRRFDDVQSQIKEKGPDA